MEDVAVRILGPLSVTVGCREIAPSPPKQRRVLALLLVHDSSVVTVPEIIDELWDESPPKTAVTIVQTYVLGLRKHLSNALGLSRKVVDEELLQTRNNGYLFKARQLFFDVREYRETEEAARVAMRLGDRNRAIQLFHQAEELWRGPVLGDIEHGVSLRAEIARLEQSRLVAKELRIELELLNGRHHDSLSELSALVLQNPFNEKLHGFFMQALHRSGRRAEALGEFHRLRRNLAEELGLAPSSEIGTIYHQILNSDVDQPIQGIAR